MEESSAVFTVWSLRRHPDAPACPGPASPPLESRRCSRVRESRSGGEGGLCPRRGGGWLCQSPVLSSQSPGPPPSLLLFRTPREETEHCEDIFIFFKKVGRYYGDCVAGLLWAELGDRLGLQLPGGAPLGRPPAAPLSRPSEFSSISWMRGGHGAGDLHLQGDDTLSAWRRDKKI